MSLAAWWRNLWATPAHVGAAPVPLPDAPGRVSDPPWLTIARGEMGQAEIRGDLNNARIIAYHSLTTLKARADEVPWCASFVGWCLIKAGEVSTKSAAARSYETWGVKLNKPKLGAVVVFTRAGGGHVGFWVGEKDGKWLILGGNQGDAVTIAPFDTARVLAVRWPR